MKPNQTVPLAVSIAPMLAAAPPVLIGAAIGLGLIWLFSDKKPSAKPDEASPAHSTEPDEFPVESKPLRGSAPRRITREDIAEALGYGERPISRTDAVAALQTLGFKKTAAYKALSPEGRFADLLEHSADGSIEWKG